MEHDDSRILFTRHWWKRLYQQRHKARGVKRKAQLRKEMRQVAKNLVEMCKESTR